MWILVLAVWLSSSQMRSKDQSSVIYSSCVTSKWSEVEFKHQFIYGWPFILLIIYCLQRRKRYFHPVFHFPNSSKSQGWAMLGTQCRNWELNPALPHEWQDPTIGSTTCCLAGTLAGNWHHQWHWDANLYTLLCVSFSKTCLFLLER